MRLREARERRSCRERVQPGRVEKDTAESEDLALEWEVKYAFAAAASAAAGSTSLLGEGDRRSCGTSSSESDSSASLSRFARAANPVGSAIVDH